MPNVVLRCKENNDFDVVELKSGKLMYRGALDETIELIRREKAIQKLIKMKEVKDKKFKAWQEAEANLISGIECSHTVEFRRECATRCTYKYDGAYTMCKAMYGEETIRDVISVYFGELNR